MTYLLLDWLLRTMIQLSRSFKVQITSVLVEHFKVLNSLWIVFECPWKTWFDVRLLSRQEFVDVSRRLHVNIIGKMCKCWISQQSDIKSCFPMTFKDNWWNFHFERSNSDLSKNVGWKALNCESRSEIGHLQARYSYIVMFFEN